MQKEKFRNEVFGFVDTIVRMQRRRWVLRCAGLAFRVIPCGFAVVRRLAHRCEVVQTEDGVTWVNDSKATNVGAAVSAIRSFGDGAPLILIAGGQAKQEDYGVLARTLARMASSRESCCERRRSLVNN